MATQFIGLEKKLTVYKIITNTALNLWRYIAELAIDSVSMSDIKL